MGFERGCRFKGLVALFSRGASNLKGGRSQDGRVLSRVGKQQSGKFCSYRKRSVSARTFRSTTVDTRLLPDLGRAELPTTSSGRCFGQPVQPGEAHRDAGSFGE